MQKFIVSYCMPRGDMATWMAKPEAERKEAEAKMMAQWDAWLDAQADLLVFTASAGTNERITKTGSTDAKNDTMMVSLVEAESVEAVKAILKEHPHFGISTAWIELMSVTPLPGCERK